MFHTGRHIEEIEEKIHEWFIDNQDKVNPKLWWDICSDFLHNALAELNISLEDYQRFYQAKAIQHGIEIQVS